MAKFQISMKCQDCVDKKAKYVNKAEYVLAEYDFVRLLCQGCLDEYCYAEGESNLDFFHLETELEGAFKKISGNLEFVSSQYRRLLKESSELKRAQNSTPGRFKMIDIQGETK